MTKESKGDITKKFILDRSREIFNSKGINLTLDSIARELNVTKGRFTNHFPAKDNLFLAIVADYEEQFQLLLKKYHIQYESLELQSAIFILSKIMDIQFKYRCGIVYINMLGPSQSDLSVHIQSSYQKNALLIKYRLEKMVEMKTLRKEVLQTQNLQSFLFVYVNMLTQWVVFYEMYDRKKNYKKVKSLYLRAVLEHSYFPYFTKKGLEEFQNLDFNAI